MEEEKWVIDQNNQNRYSRGYHSDLDTLNKALRKCYSHADIPLESIVATSGMHAITITLDAVVGKLGDCNLVYGSELYCDTLAVIAERVDAKIFPINVIDTSSIMELFGSIAGQKNILFIESCSNPSGHIFDFRIIPELRRMSKELLVIVDNTWLTHVVFNPFLFDVDIVVMSLTKYYSGGAVIAGASLFRGQHSDLQQSVRSMLRWVHISGHDCTVITKNMTTMQNRLESSSLLCLQLLDVLCNMQQCRACTEIGQQFTHCTHPSLEHHPSYDLAKLFFNRSGISQSQTLYPSCFTIYVSDISMSKLRKVLSQNSELDFITSFGCPMSRIDPYPQRCALDEGRKDVIRLRIAVGYRDDCDRVINGLQQIALAMQQAKLVVKRK